MELETAQSKNISRMAVVTKAMTPRKFGRFGCQIRTKAVMAATKVLMIAFSLTARRFSDENHTQSPTIANFLYFPTTR